MRAAASVTVTTIRAESWIAISCDTALDKLGYQAVHSRFHVENVRIANRDRHGPSGTAPTVKFKRTREPSHSAHVLPVLQLQVTSGPNKQFPKKR